MKIEDLSPRARQLADKLGHNGNIADALKEDPSLIEGLDEYQKWRDHEHNVEGQHIGQDSSKPSFGHGIAERLKKLPVPKPKQKRKKK